MTRYRLAIYQYHPNGAYESEPEYRYERTVGEAGFKRVAREATPGRLRATWHMHQLPLEQIGEALLADDWITADELLWAFRTCRDLAATDDAYRLGIGELHPVYPPDRFIAEDIAAARTADAAGTEPR